MKVVLTGAAGFIGSAIRAALLERGHDVVGVDAFIPQAHPVDVRRSDGVERVDVRDASQLKPLIEGADVVCHQAAMVGAGVTAADLPLYAGHNDLGTAVLLAVMAEVGVFKLVLASSMVVYGDGRYTCHQHGSQPASHRTLAALEARRFDVGCPVCGS
ncbi:MAG: NAD(P)-dependent oxidoreductase, partial [Nocardioidaceae bacterium]